MSNRISTSPPKSQSTSPSLSREQVAHLADLARLALTESELDHYTAELRSILSYVEQLRAVDTSGVSLTGNITGLTNVLAADETGADSIDRDQFLAEAPASQLPYLKVKAVLE